VIALKLPELAVLSAMAHRDLDAADVAVEAIAPLPEDVSRLYFDLIVSRLPEGSRRLLEARMQGYQYQSEFARKYYGQGHEEGLKKGLDEGLKKGLDEGLKQGLRDAVLALARVRFDEVTAEDQAAIAALHDPLAATQLIGALAMAPTQADARVAFQLVVDRQ
jgi:flagellar biosynthesis/type III secretory pathway protein FliH